jgi:hypothetical protein
MAGGDGDDRLLGGFGNDTLRGGKGNDMLDGGPGRDVMSSNAGDDEIIPDGDDKQVNKGSGNDIVRTVSPPNDPTPVAQNLNHTVSFGGDDVLYGDAESTRSTHFANSPMTVFFRPLFIFARIGTSESVYVLHSGKELRPLIRARLSRGNRDGCLGGRHRGHVQLSKHREDFQADRLIHTPGASTFWKILDDSPHNYVYLIGPLIFRYELSFDFIK